MANTTPISPDKQLDTESRQPVITGSPPQPSPEQFMNSYSPNFIQQQPENSADAQLPPLLESAENLLETPAPPSPQPENSVYSHLSLTPETVEVLEEPTTPSSPTPEKLAYGHLPPLPEAVENPQEPSALPPPEKLAYSHIPPPLEAVENLQEPSASPPPENLAYGQVPPSTEAVVNLQESSESPSYQPENTADGQLPPLPESVEILQEPPAPPLLSPERILSDSQSSPHTNVITPSSPLEATEQLTENPSPNRESIPSKQSQSQQPSPSPAAEEHTPENTSHNGESQPPSSPTEIENSSESPNHGINPNPNFEHSVIKHSLSIEPEEPTESSDFHIIPIGVKLERNAIPITHQSVEEPSPSPDLSPSSPQFIVEQNIGLVTPPIALPPPGFSPIRPQISPWTHQETANLIQAYQEKWYSLKKGPLRAGQWEEVAITVAARCGYEEPTKTAKQCRHKIEKLRKRYRAERGKPRSKANDWNFFKVMDNLEKGPLPISSSQGMALVEYQKPSNSNGKKRKNEYSNDSGDVEYLGNRRSSRPRSTNHYVPNGDLTRNLRVAEGGNKIVRGLRTPMVHKPREFYQQVDDGVEEEEENNGDGGDEEEVALQLAAEIKGFAEKFVKMEKKKIEMIRDVERDRLEMENKRTEMILESQQILVETVNKAFGSSHKRHKLSAK